MGTRKNFKSLRRRGKRDVKRFYAISFFTILLLCLGFFFWFYFLFSVSHGVSCMVAAHWVLGWFDYGSPMQFLALLFFLSFVIWLIRLYTGLGKDGLIETSLQGILILGFAMSLGFLKALIIPFGTPSYEQARQLAEIISPIDVRLVEEPSKIRQAPSPWPYDFPPPPPGPDLRDWLEGYNPDFSDFFSSKNSPILGEYDEMLQCTVRYQARKKDYARVVAEYQAWEDE